MPVPDIDGIACLPVELWAAVLAALPIPERARISGVSHRLAAASLLALAMPFTLDFRGIKCEKKIKKMVSGHTKKRATGIVILGARDDIVASVVGFHLSTLKRLEIIGWNTRNLFYLRRKERL